MRIGIEATSLARNFPSGIQNYTRNLLNSLAKIDKKNEYFIFSTNSNHIPNQKNFKFVDISGIPILKKQLLLPIKVRQYKIDTFHYIEPYGSMFLKCPKIITTVPDVDLDITYPKFKNLTFFLKRYYSGLLRFFVFKKTDLFIAISKSTASELRRYLTSRHLHQTINTIYLSVCGKLYYKKTKKVADYFLCMGDFSPRKNVKFIFEVYSKMPENFKNIYLLKTVVSTKKEAIRYKKLINSLGIAKYISIIISPTDNRLRNLYSQAKAFLYPSLYEGFGLPILEAMSCGCPVITSNFGSMKEVAGSAALFIDPRSEKSLSKALTDMVTSPDKSNKLISMGYKRVNKFSWEKTARQTLSLYLK